jgi:hypothetical protein
VSLPPPPPPPRYFILNPSQTNSAS